MSSNSDDCRKALHSVYHYSVEDIVDSGIGLSYRPVSLCSLAGRYDNPMPESTFFPPVRDFEFGFCIPWRSVVVLGREPANDEAADEQNQPQDHCRVHILNSPF
jgi:hypothetical protein